MSIHNDQKGVMFEILRTYWNSITPKLGPIIRPNIKGATSVPEQNIVWCRFTPQTVERIQSSLSCQNCKRRFTVFGVLTIQLFSPIGEGNSQIDDIVTSIVNLYTNHKGDLWFRNVRWREIGESGAFYQTNIICDYIYDEVL